jgi:hypothetical protein
MDERSFRLGVIIYKLRNEIRTEIKPEIRPEGHKKNCFD